jgi:exosortase E/protease (VPEID-CTERM system)
VGNLSPAPPAGIVPGEDPLSFAPSPPRFGLLVRLLVLALVLATELLAITVWVNGDALSHRPTLIRFAGIWGTWILRGTVGFAVIFATFAYLKNKPAIERLSDQFAGAPVGWGFLAAHAALLGIFGLLTSIINGSPDFYPDLVAVGWMAAGISAIVFGVLAFVPLSIWAKTVRSTGLLWLYALVAIVLACLIGGASQSLWRPAGRITFWLVDSLLGLFSSNVFSNPSTMIIGTSTFRVEIAPQCSGFEGAGLILIFGVVWLWLFRSECRFPQALLLIPAGLALIFLLNAVRIAALILIGNAGAPQIALGGFHSQAGWIAFNVVALGFSVAARNIPWVVVRESRPQPTEKLAENSTAAYLVPFLAILGAGMLASAAAGGFEWLYPLRFFAAAGALWVFRGKYVGLNWKVSWFGPAVGILVFGIWIVLDRFTNGHALNTMPAALIKAPGSARVAWIVLRVLTAVVTVPIAEELAFRGFVFRRLISADFEAVSSSKFTWLALGVSSLIFGILHGERWLAGTLAGALYAMAMVRRGRIGDAVAAHAITNALLAAYVLAFSAWSLW